MGCGYTYVHIGVELYVLILAVPNFMYVCTLLMLGDRYCWQSGSLGLCLLVLSLLLFHYSTAATGSDDDHMRDISLHDSARCTVYTCSVYH